ncbi:hypothetical protein PEDI_39820 [Persicobacter diffluens]|uniref:Uncharacterized protein n=1 Tax=Persicobacter diffluens TaxID=981 RepID=A0AAN5AL20_9BACT|nr:hypothetical protein PEDI_39820 [Persicobacter diffluens]
MLLRPFCLGASAPKTPKINKTEALHVHAHNSLPFSIVIVFMIKKICRRSVSRRERTLSGFWVLDWSLRPVGCGKPRGDYNRVHGTKNSNTGRSMLLRPFCLGASAPKTPKINKTEAFHLHTHNSLPFSIVIVFMIKNL